MPKRREGPTSNKQTGYYFFDEYIGFPPNKHRVRFSLRTKDPLKAKWLWEKEYRRKWSEYYDIEKLKIPEPIFVYDISREFIEYQRDVKRTKEWTTMRSRLRIICEILGEVRLDKISEKHLIDLDKYLHEKHKSKATINNYFTLLKSVFNYAIKKENYFGMNPVSEFVPYEIDKKQRIYSQDEIEKVLRAADRIEKEARSNAFIQKHSKNIVLIILHTGLELGEIFNLKWENIVDKSIVRNKKMARKGQKKIPLTPAIISILQNLQRVGQKNQYVLPIRKKGGKMQSYSHNPVIEKIRLYSHVNDFTFRDLSKTAKTIIQDEKNYSISPIKKVDRVKEITPLDTPKDISWYDITIKFISSESIELKAKNPMGVKNFIELGFKDYRKGSPDKLWSTLLLFAKYNGEISWDDLGLPLEKQKNLKSDVKRLRMRLKHLFQLHDDPFENYTRYKAYKTKFSINLRDDEIS